MNPEAARRQALSDWLCNKQITLNFFLEDRPYGSQPANKVLMRFWKRHFLFLPFWMSKAMHRLAQNQIGAAATILTPAPSVPSIDWVQTSEVANQMLPKWAKIAAHETFPDKFKRKPYVMVHVRDDLYLAKEYPQINWSHHSYRDQNIDNFVPAIEYLLDRGYGVVRSGKYARQPVLLEHPYLVDLPFSDMYSEQLDVALWSNCAFAIGTGSGPDVAPFVVGNPALVCGMLPFFQEDSNVPYSRAYISRLVNLRTGSPLSEQQIRQLITRDWITSQMYENADLTIMPMADDEVLRAVAEFVAEFEIHGSNLKKYPGPVQRFFPWWGD